MNIPYFFRRTYRILVSLGIDLRLVVRSLCNIPKYFQDIRRYRRLNAGSFYIQKNYLYPVLGDRNEWAAKIDGHYFLQDLWAAQKIFQRKPACHMDIGSRIDGFIAHLLIFMPVTVIDVRPFEVDLENLTFIRADGRDLSTIQTESILSLSSLHAVEHFGLGRYGDEVDPEAWFKAMRAMARILAIGGRLYFSVPIGKERLEFNAHRIFDPRTILDQFSDLSLQSFCVINDIGDFIRDASPEDYSGVLYSCGLFEFTKL